MNKELILDYLGMIEKNICGIRLDLMNHDIKEVYIKLVINNKLSSDLLHQIATTPSAREFKNG